MFPVGIVCGNTYVMKPSEKDPGAAVFLAKLFQQAGVPDGVLNIVHGGKVTSVHVLYVSIYTNDIDV